MKHVLSTLILLAVLLAGCTNPTAAPSDMPTPARPETQVPTDIPPTAEPTIEPTAIPTAAPTVVEPPATRRVAYIGRDDNLWLVDAASGTKQQLTMDAAGYNTNNAADVILYQTPTWSSDGRYLAFERQVGKVIESGYSFSYSLLTYDSTTAAIQPVLENTDTVGFAWKPGTHQLTFAKAVDPNYFTARGKVDSTLATGIYWLDLDSGGAGELVKPEAGYALVSPQWAPNGQMISFNELVYMEGQGPFAYYDFTTNQYVRWEKPIGNVDWSQDGSQLLHDNLTYTPSYTERIYLINRDRSGERQLSAELENSYASNPLYSPLGNQIAYLQVTGLDPDPVIKLMLLELPDGQPRELVQLVQAYNLTWTPDGQSLLVATGNYPETQVVLISAEDGSSKVLADGWQAVMQP
jgi:dipeptidyl aminopeptidase/acylaminoacyl peptidase